MIDRADLLNKSISNLDIRINDIKVGNRFRKDLGDLEPLKQSIRDIGLLHPLVINENNELVCGYRRIVSCEQLGYELIPVRKINLQDIVNGEIHENILRKDFSILERYEIRKALEPIEKQKAEQRMLSGKPSGNLPKGRALDNIAKVFGISRKTLEKETEIVEAAKQNPEQFGHYLERIDSGETSIDYVHKMVKRSEDHKNIPKLPEGEYDIILADPPWNYNIMTRGSPDEHYEVMTDKEIQELKIPAAENAMLFLWATGPKLPEALSVINSWNFNYKTSFVWVKDKIGTGYYCRGQHELLLVAERGDMPTPQEKDRVSSVIEAPTKKHSEKPEVVYEIIEQMYPNRKYLELFARSKREGWISWGNELELEVYQK